MYTCIYIPNMIKSTKIYRNINIAECQPYCIHTHIYDTVVLVRV